MKNKQKGNAREKRKKSPYLKPPGALFRHCGRAIARPAWLEHDGKQKAEKSFTMAKWVSKLLNEMGPEREFPFFLA